ncbi:MAG: hypothetical protein ACTSUF_03445 [Candidatus Heimdallarchaeaceae archaeon]
MTELCVEIVDENRFKVVDCSTGKEIDICSLCGGRVASRRKKRAPSEYNKFMSTCVKGKSGPIQERFKSCAGEWRRKK